MRVGKEFKRTDTTKESIGIEAKKDLDQQSLNMLIDPENGVLRAGLLPQVGAATPAGAKALLGSIQQAGWNNIGMCVQHGGS